MWELKKEDEEDMGFRDGGGIRVLLALLIFFVQLHLVASVSITSIYPHEHSFDIGSSIEINATITDGDGISSAYVNVTYPNATVEQIVLDSYPSDLYNTSFAIPHLPGTYSILVWANDTLNTAATDIANFTAVFSDPTNIGGIRLWLDASDNRTLYTDASCTTLVSADFDEVLCWENKVGGTNATVLSGKSGARYRSNSSERVNGLTTLKFNKSGESVYETGLDIRANTTEDLTIFTVYRPRTTDTSDQGQAIWGNDNGAWDRFYYSLFSESVGLGTDGIDDGLISLGGASSGLSIDGAGIVDTIFLLTAIYNGNVSGGVNSGPVNGSGIYFDGELQIAFTDESHATAAQTQMFIGRDGDNGYYDGDLVEVIVYDTIFDACELETVNKHLSSKYGRDFFGISENYGHSSPHTNDINGISEISGNCTATVEITSGTSSIATLSSPTDLDLGDSLTFAHDTIGLQTISESPVGYESRVNQSWRVDEDGEVGNVTVSFDMSTTTISTSSSDFALIIDTNTNFTDATVHTTGFSVSGDIVSFTGVNFSHGDYFTLAVTENFNDPTDLTNLRAWYDATDNTTLYTDEACMSPVAAHDDSVLCWEDKSSYSHNATNVSGKGTPVFATNTFNGKSVVSFNKSQGDTLRHALGSQYTSNFTIFIVMQSKDESPSTFESFFSNGEPASTDHFQIDYTSTGNAFRYGSTTKFNFETFSNEVKLYAVTHNGSDVVLYNEGQQVTSGATTEGQVFEHYRINQNRNGDSHHDSNIAEIILYGRVLTACELEKVNVYLGEKYGRDFFGVSDNYGYGAPYSNDINGIGEFNSSCTTTKEFVGAQSSVATILDASSLDLGDALTFAHDNGGFSLNSQVPSNYTHRINQTWRVDEDNEPGNVSVSFDLSTMGISELSSDFALLVDTDTNFTDATMHTVGFSVSGNVITFTNVNFTDGDYFTLAVTEKAPTLAFVSPTVANGSIQNQNHFIVNVTSDSFGEDHYTFVDFNDSLVFWMSMDDVNGSGDPIDLSGNGNNGSLIGSPVINSTGRFGDAIHLDGVNDYINVSDSPSLQLGSGDFAFASWFSLKGYSSGDQQIMSKRVGSEDYEIQVEDTKKIKVYLGDGGGSNTIESSFNVSLTTWYHTVVTRENGTVYLYVNGTLEDQMNFSGDVSSDAPLYIGNDPAQPTELFNGSIDEVLIFNRSLGSAEVLSLYNATLHQYEHNFTTLHDGNYSFVGHSVGINGERNQTGSRVVTIDLTAPQVHDLIPIQNTVFDKEQIIEISTNVTDAVAVDMVYVNITYPNSTVKELVLTQQSGDLYNASFFIPDIEGVFNLTFFANDTAGNVNSTEQSNFTSADLFYPGGISSGLTLWLDAGRNNTVFSDNCGGNMSGHDDVISCWQDFSGNSYHFNSSSSNRPLLKVDDTTSLNFNPLVLFDGSNDFLEDADGESYINGASGLTFFSVTQSKVIGTDRGFFTTDDIVDDNDDEFSMRYDANGADGGGTNVIKIGINTTSSPQAKQIESRANIQTLEPQLLSFDWSSGDSMRLFLHGGNTTHTSDEGVLNGTVQNADSVIVGRGTKISNHYWNGTVGEIIYYNERLNATARNKVESYLAIKYGITLNATLDYISSDGTVVYNSTGAYQNYIYDIAGIGRDDESGLNQTRSQSVHSDSIVRVEHATSLDDGDFLVWGNDNATLDEVNGSFGSLPVGILNRTQRVWRADMTGDVGLVDMRFDLSGLTISGTSVSDFHLLVNETGTHFSSPSRVVAASSFSNDVVVFESVNFSDGDYFTLSTLNDTAAPQVFNLSLTPTSTYNFTAEVNISVNVTDNVEVDFVYATVTLPNGTAEEVVLSLGLGDEYRGLYSAAGLVGEYTVVIVANDTVNTINNTENATFQVLNAVPSPSAVIINDGSDVDLSSGSNVTIVGSATITDLNGYGDISSVVGRFFLTTVGEGGVVNRSNYYFSTCSENGDGSGNSVSYNCTFTVSHYATATDAGSNASVDNWTFLVAPLDNQGTGSNGTDFVEVNTLLSFSITPSLIDFGNLDLGENTTTTNKVINVTNLGNVNIDILLSGSNLSCSPGSVPVHFLEYEESPFSYGIGTDLLESDVELDLDVGQGREEDPTPLKSTYYGLGIPGSSVGGACSGSIIVTGQSDPARD